jgi:hypothetical protein
LLIVVLFGFLNIKSVKIYAIAFIFSTTLLLYKLDTLLYSAIETKEAARIGYNGFLFPHEYSDEGRGAYITGFFFRMITQVKAEVRSTKAGT